VVKNKSKLIGIALLTVIVMLSSSFVLGSYQGSIVKNPASVAVLSTSNGHLEYTDLNNNVSQFSFHSTLSRGENPLGAGSTISTISVGSFPWGIAYNNATQQIFVANSLSSYFSVIQSSTNTVSYSLSLPPSPFDIAYDPSNSYLYATDTTLSVLWVLTPSSPQSSTYSVLSDITLPAAGYGVAYDPGNNLIYVAIPSLNEVIALDPGTGALEATVTTGISDPLYLVYVPTDNYMWVTDRGSNSVTAINSSTNQDAGSESVGSSPFGIAYDSTNKDVYVANYDSGSISVVDLITASVSSISIPGQRVESVAYNPINNLIYVTDYYNTNTLSAGNTVSVINATTDSLLGTITVGDNPVSVIYNPSNGDMYVTNSGSDTVSVISSPSVFVSSPSSIDAGQTATLTANPTSGSGSYTSYSWYAKPPGSSSFSIVSGVTTQTLSYATLTSSIVGTYYFEATVTDSNGATSLLSGEAGLTVYSDPTISISPSGPITYKVGQTASQLTASVTYSGPNTASVEWYSNDVNSNSGGVDTGVSGASYNPSTSTTGTVYYYATVRDSGVQGYSSPSGVVEVTVSPIHHQSQVKYLVNFGETGLPAGTTWDITVNGQTYSSNTQLISLTLPSGQNSYEVGGVAGYYPSPSYGTINVDYAPFAVEIVFSPNAMNGYLTGSIPSTYSLFIDNVEYNTSQGQFNIALKPGNYTVEVKYPGVPSYYSNVTIHPSMSTALNLGVLITSPDHSVSIISPLTVLMTTLLVSLFALVAVIELKIRRLRK
jgi:YVTN family beta-propeller protein